MFEAAGVSHDALSIASNEAPASARRNALERTAEQHPNDNFQEKDIPSCRTTFSFVSRRNAIRLSITSDGRFPNAEVKNAQDQGRRYFAGLHQGSEAELVAWEARQAYIGMGFLLFAAAGMGIDSTALEGIDFPKLNEILGLDEKNLTAIAAVSLGYRSPKDGNAQRPKSRLTRDELFTSLD